jgi:tryptophan synthase alpha chain
MMTTLPIAVGFGLSRRAQIEALNPFADGAIVGSALVEVIHQAGKANAAKAAYDFMTDLFAGTKRG